MSSNPTQQQKDSPDSVATVPSGRFLASQAWLSVAIADAFSRLNAGALGERKAGFAAFMKLMLLRIRKQVPASVLETALAQFMQSRAKRIVEAVPTSFQLGDLVMEFTLASEALTVTPLELPHLLAACLSEGNRVLLQYASELRLPAGGVPALHAPHRSARLPALPPPSPRGPTPATPIKHTAGTPQSPLTVSAYH
jgi:hypothetical protein